jgi:hypothetical protein
MDVVSREGRAILRGWLFLVTLPVFLDLAVMVT